MRARRLLPGTRAGLLPLAAAALVTATLAGTSAPAEVLTARGTSGSEAARGSNQFGVRVGSSAGLHPGGEVSVRVTYSNPFGFGLVVGSQNIRVTSPSPTCSATTVDLSRALTVLAKRVVVPARGATTVTIPLSMRATAPDACQGVRFTTSIEAQGRKK